MNNLYRRHSPRLAWFVAFSLLAVFYCINATVLLGQDEPAGSVQASDITDIMNDPGEAEAEVQAAESPGIDLLSLVASGGKFMIPILLMSLLVVTLAVERLLVLRKNRIVPRKLRRELEELSDPTHQFNPASAYQACQEYPSPAARVVSAMLLRTGQPLGEIERTASDTVQREADQYTAPIRWLNLAAAATPLMGLLGTVWGMIVAFHESTTLTADRSRSEQLSEGIYTALVTTLAGLVVAIPAAILAQYLENRAIRLFHAVEELAFDIAPGLARFTGRRRLDVDGSLKSIETTPSNGTATQPNGPPTPPPPPPMPDTPSKSNKRDGAKTG